MRKLLSFRGYPSFALGLKLVSLNTANHQSQFSGLCWLCFIFFILLVRISTSSLSLFSSVSGNGFQRASHPPGNDLIHQPVRGFKCIQ